MFRARIRAYRVPQREYANDLGPVFPPVGIIVSVNPIMREFTYPRTFWLKPVSNFGFSTLTMVITVHLSWPYHPNPRPSPPVAGRFSLSSRFSLQFPAGTSPGSFTQDGYPSCMCRRVSLTEQRVPLTGQFNEATSRRTIMNVIQQKLQQGKDAIPPFNKTVVVGN